MSYGDPGHGLWIPPGTTDRLIADTSGPSAAYLSSYIPGCLNGDYITSSYNSGCGAKSSFVGKLVGTNKTVSFSFGSGRVLGLRYTSKAEAGKAVRWLTLFSADGGNVGQTLKFWLSDNPTASFASTSSSCKDSSTRNPGIITGPGYCSIKPNKRYYVFISTDDVAENLRYVINEGASDLF